jgi:hypothetical protein
MALTPPPSGSGRGRRARERIGEVAAAPRVYRARLGMQPVPAPRAPLDMLVADTEQRASAYVRSLPKKGTNMAAVDSSARPVNGSAALSFAQALVQRIPAAGLLPVAQSPPSGHSGAALLGQVLPSGGAAVSAVSFSGRVLSASAFRPSSSAVASASPRSSSASSRSPVWLRWRSMWA